VLEARWKAAPPEERDLWQGLAQVCVGLTHRQRGNEVGAVRLLLRGAGRLEDYAGPSYGVDVVSVVEQARAGGPVVL
jgi:predicted metal-dependent hydrolase